MAGRAAAAMLLACASALAAGAAPLRPHLVMLVADDYGWHNIGFRNPEVKSPTLDHLAKTGIILDRHYVFIFCSPTRSSLMTGRLPLHVNQNNECGSITSRSGADIRMTLLPEKLRGGGYRTHMTGKWHCGARTAANLPINRGFDTHFGFLEGGEDHNTQRTADSGQHYVDLWRGHGPAYGENGTFSAELYGAEAVRTVMEHPDPSIPYFLYLPFQVTHAPYQVPDRFRDPAVNNTVRQTFNAMVRAMDEAVANLTDALEARKMLQRTLIIFTADNGGIWRLKYAGNNWPLRGQKGTAFEGGVRATAFVWGGADVLPTALRGTTHTGLIHVCDWYATLSRLAGVSADDDVAGVPPPDSVDVWDSLLLPHANSTNRTEVPLAFCPQGGEIGGGGCLGTAWVNNGSRQIPDNAALISGRHKLVWGTQHNDGGWVGPVWPNGTEVPTDDPGCPDGCLFDIFADPSEKHDLKAELPDIFARLKERMLDVGVTAWQTNYSDVEDPAKCLSPLKLKKKYNDFLAPPCSASH
eukprot:TRINITY_DN2828_c0_g1_i1.p1 TRINITY_DN2828_c0_g1~~TRINITY_DN2828_c0_g1_i1.p1  ORF type:complete len:558 (+),score=141.16 TRINITY_DN2828_c0_g1_i1:102-1676(+)